MSSKITRKFLNLPINDLKPYERNNKIHDKENVEEIARSIEKNSYVSPIVVDENYVIIAWHGRQLALMTLGYETVDVLVIDWLSENQKKDIRLRDNKLSQLGDRDIENIKIELMSIQDEELNGLFDDIIQGLQTDEQEVKEQIEDYVPELSDETEIFVQKWDIYQLGDHVLMCGDSMNEDNVKKLLEGKTSEFVHCISDPPYGISYESVKHGGIQNDDTYLDYIGLAQKYTNWFFCLRTGYQVVDQRKLLCEKAFTKINNMIIRHKGGGAMGDTKRTLAQDYEIVLVCNRGNEIQWHRGSVVFYWNEEEKEEFIKKADKKTLQEVLAHISKGETIRKVWKDASSEYLHPTQKPIEINSRLLTNFTRFGDTVVDLFGWSGSNLIACEKNNRKCRMMELDERFVQVIIQRYHNYMLKKGTIKCLNRDFNVQEYLV